MTSTRTCRIGLLTPGWPGQNTPNGIATSVYFLAKGLQQIGQTPVIIANRIDGPCPQDIPVVPVTQFGWRWHDRLRARLGDGDAVHRQIARTIAHAVRKAIETHGLDAVIMEETNGWAGLVQKQVPVPIFVFLHGPWVLHKDMQSVKSPREDLRREKREAITFLHAAGLIAPSRNVLETIVATTPAEGRHEIVLPNALAQDRSADLSATIAPQDILFVGRFDVHKGGDTVIEAFSCLAEKYPKARLTFVGVDQGIRQKEGPARHLRTVLPGLPEDIRSRINYKGPVDREEVMRLRSEHAIALIASRFENLNYSLLEAMAAGQAIVCTAVGGPAEVLEDRKTALLVPPGDPEAMAAALGRLLDDAALRQQLGEAARVLLEKDFSPPVIASRTVDFITTALAGGVCR